MESKNLLVVERTEQKREEFEIVSNQPTEMTEESKKTEERVKEMTKNGKVDKEENKKNKTKQIRTKCEVYSRVVGYFRPVEQWNEGKQAEWCDRKVFAV